MANTIFADELELGKNENIIKKIRHFDNTHDKKFRQVGFQKKDTKKILPEDTEISIATNNQDDSIRNMFYKSFQRRFWMLSSGLVLSSIFFVIFVLYNVFPSMEAARYTDSEDETTDGERNVDYKNGIFNEIVKSSELNLRRAAKNDRTLKKIIRKDIQEDDNSEEDDEFKERHSRTKPIHENQNYGNIIIFEGELFEQKFLANSSGWIYLEIKTNSERKKHLGDGSPDKYGEYKREILVKRSYTVQFDMFFSKKTRYKWIPRDETDVRKKLKNRSYKCCCSVVDISSRFQYEGGEKICTDNQNNDEYETDNLLLDCYVNFPPRGDLYTRMVISLEKNIYKSKESIDESHIKEKERTENYLNDTRILFSKYVVESCFVEF
jgi:hypothetical protein